MLDFMTDPAAWVLISFVIFVGIAFVMGRKTILKMLDDKIQVIRNDIANAEALRDQAQKLLLEYETKQKAAHSEAERMLSAAKQQAADLHAKAEKDLVDTMQHRESMMKERISRMEEDAREEIRRYAANLAISATTEIISQRLDATSAAKLADQSITKIGENLN